MCENYLVYDDQPIKHRMLVLHEAAGMSGEYATYLIRTLLQRGLPAARDRRVDPEGLKPVMVVREGPAGLITSTTQVNLHAGERDPADRRSRSTTPGSRPRP